MNLSCRRWTKQAPRSSVTGEASTSEVHNQDCDSIASKTATPIDMPMGASLRTSTAPLLPTVLVAEAIALLVPLDKELELDALLEVPPVLVLAALDPASVTLASAAATVTVMYPISVSVLNATLLVSLLGAGVEISSHPSSLLVVALFKSSSL